MASREDRIVNLATTLKSSGLAKSEVQARMMAEEMIGVEENVQKRYDEEHARAHEYLKTAKNLGDTRIKPSSQQPKIQPLPAKPEPMQPVHEESKKVVLEEVKTDVNIGQGTLKDLMLNQIQQEKHEVKNIEELKPVSEVKYEPSHEEMPAQAPVTEPKLDSEKLAKMMEEDGPLEEHTREIKEKPKDTKPKEEYEENNI